MAKVLVVDDSPLVRVILCDFLRDLGHEAISAGTADEAISLCGAHHPDLVIKDLVMEDTDPCALMDDLRRIIPGLPIVICSTMGRRQEICAAIRAGATDFLVKPFGRDDVSSLMQHYTT
ncbi:MAG: response regulator [Bacteroidota bacterium]